jgi:hypothetical protein
MSLPQYNPKNGYILVQVKGLEEHRTANIKGSNGDIELVLANHGIENPLDTIKENGIVIFSNEEDIPVGSKAYFHYLTLENQESRIDEANGIYSVHRNMLICIYDNGIKMLNNNVLGEVVYEDGIEFEDGITFKRAGSFIIPCEAKPLKNLCRILYSADEEFIGKVYAVDSRLELSTYSVVEGKKYIRFTDDLIHAEVEL